MLSFKEFVLAENVKRLKNYFANDNESNDNAKEKLPEVDPTDVRRKYMSLHNKKRDAWEEKQYQALKNHPALKEGYNAKPAVVVDLTVKDKAKPAVSVDQSVQGKAKPAVAVDQSLKPKKLKPPKTAPMTPVE